MDKRIEIDLGAERIIEATKRKEEISIEIKSFSVPSVFYEFHGALVEYKNYQRLLKLVGINRV